MYFFNKASGALVEGVGNEKYILRHADELDF